MPHKQIAAAGRSLLFFGGNRFCNASCGFIKRAPRPRRESGVNRTLLVTDMWFQKARAGDTDAAWLFARASLCGCALAASARARALALSGLVALRSRRLVPFRHGDNRCAAVFSLPRAMLVNIDVVIKTWR